MLGCAVSSSLKPTSPVRFKRYFSCHTIFCGHPILFFSPPVSRCTSSSFLHATEMSRTKSSVLRSINFYTEDANRVLLNHQLGVSEYINWFCSHLLTCCFSLVALKAMIAAREDTAIGFGKIVTAIGVVASRAITHVWSR